MNFKVLYFTNKSFWENSFQKDVLATTELIQCAKDFIESRAYVMSLFTINSVFHHFKNTLEPRTTTIIMVIIKTITNSRVRLKKLGAKLIFSRTFLINT